MTQLSKNYARVLYELGISKEAIEEARELSECKELIDALNSPVVSKQEKRNVADKVFPKEIRSFIKQLCDYGSVSYIKEIFEAYDEYVDEVNDVVAASLICVVPPTEEQKEKIEQFLMEEYGKTKVRLEISIDRRLIGGFMLKVKDREYDWSMKGRILQLAGHLKNI